MADEKAPEMSDGAKLYHKATTWEWRWIDRDQMGLPCQPFLGMKSPSGDICQMTPELLAQIQMMMARGPYARPGSKS